MTWTPTEKIRKLKSSEGLSNLVGVTQLPSGGRGIQTSFLWLWLSLWSLINKWLLQCGPHTSSSSIEWKVVRNANSHHHPQPRSADPETLRMVYQAHRATLTPLGLRAPAFNYQARSMLGDWGQAGIQWGAGVLAPDGLSSKPGSSTFSSCGSGYSIPLFCAPIPLRVK